jgi:hypothetical protein
VHWEPLSANRLQELRQIWACVRYLIVDEISMVSAATLWHIHRRLVEIMGTPEHWPFGGINLIVLGDFYQVSAGLGGTLRHVQDRGRGRRLCNLQPATCNPPSRLQLPSTDTLAITPPSVRSCRR